MLPKTEAIGKLQRQLDLIAALKQKERFSPDFQKWQRDTQVAIRYVFGDTSWHLKDFSDVEYHLRAWSSGTTESHHQQTFCRGLDSAAAVLHSLIDEVREYWNDTDPPGPQEPLLAVERICTRFHLVVKQLQSRHDKRQTLVLKDEYDVQDLLRGLLTLFFDDVRPEEHTPSHAGASSRMDFLIVDHQTAVEVKKTRPQLTDKELSDELILDIERYQKHPSCRILICFVYDPDESLRNPSAIERDLTGQRETLMVKVLIAPKGT